MIESNMEISSKLTMYDFLSMMVSGFIILFPFSCLERGDSYDIILFFILCYLVGIAYHKLLECISKPIRNIKSFIGNGKKKALITFKERNRKNSEQVSEDVDYYEAYYYLIHNKCMNVIPVLEAQVTFIRNILPLIIIYLICLTGGRFHIVFIDDCYIIQILTIVVLLLPWVWYKIQIKVYELVWEGYFFLKNETYEKNPD